MPTVFFCFGFVPPLGDRGGERLNFGFRRETTLFVPGVHSSSPGSAFALRDTKSAAVGSFLFFTIGIVEADAGTVIRNASFTASLFACKSSAHASLPSFSPSSFSDAPKFPPSLSLSLGLGGEVDGGGGDSFFSEIFSFGVGERPGNGTMPSRLIRSSSSNILSTITTASIHPTLSAHSAAVPASLNGRSASPPGETAHDRSACAKTFIPLTSSSCTLPDLIRSKYPAPA
mmetsp:Transcript_8661/g.18630  ORF Transcript_8661/g.18630 Transcript_8661/m.18630 type:complete len:230 (+) Transcript_8661:239-928(+)